LPSAAFAATLIAGQYVLIGQRMQKREVGDVAPASFLSDGLAQATAGEAHNTTVQSTAARQAVKNTSLILSGNSSPARTRGHNVRIGNNRSFRTF
jgi:hypothetical protein